MENFNQLMMKKIKAAKSERETLNANGYDREIYLALVRNSNEKIAAFTEVHADFIEEYGIKGIDKNIENLISEIEQTQVFNVFIRNGEIEVYELVRIESDKQRPTLREKIDLYSTSTVFELQKLLEEIEKEHYSSEVV